VFWYNLTQEVFLLKLFVLIGHGTFMQNAREILPVLVVGFAKEYLYW
jgi:hypothetical protein